MSIIKPFLRKILLTAFLEVFTAAKERISRFQVFFKAGVLKILAHCTEKQRLQRRCFSGEKLFDSDKHCLLRRVFKLTEQLTFPINDFSAALK